MTASPPPPDTSTPARVPRPIRQGMTVIDTSESVRIPIVLEMVRALSRASDPKEVLHSYSRGLSKLVGRRGYVSLSTRGLEPGEYRITRLLDEEAMERIEGSDPWRDGHRLAINRGGFLGGLIEAGTPQIFHHCTITGDPVVGDALADYGSLMAIPLFDQGEPLNWAIMLRREPEAFSVADLEESIIRANLVGSTVRSVLAAQELREAHRRIHREVRQIAAIQRALLPQRTPDIPGLRIATTYRVYDQAGGDYYDFVPLGGGRPHPSPDVPWGIVVADASGHGPAAAVLMAMLQTIMHAHPRVPESPAEMLSHANTHLVRKRIQNSFITAFYGIYDPTTRRLQYARAGHPPPLLKSSGPGGVVRRLDDVGSIPLGLMPDVDFETGEVTLEPGQTVVLYTDGITEAMSPDRVMFGVTGIETSLEECTGEPRCVQESIMNALRRHESSVRPSDDQTIVALRLEEPEP
jgi:sigma-B regulation protein RsbU (phosphoserine phosphatase)